MDAYRDDLAYIHDIGFGDFARHAAPGLLDLLGQNGITGGRIIDLGCGSGLWARALVRAGYDVLGIDLSAAMIALARQRVPEGAFIVGSFLAVNLPPCDAVTSLGEGFNYLCDEQNNLEALCQLFARIHAALRPGGMLVFDMAEPGRGRGHRQRHFAGADWAVMVDYDEDTAAAQLTRCITAFRQVDGAYRRTYEVHRLQLYRGAVMARQLRHIGFRVRTMRGYGAFRFPQAYVACVARKPQ